LPHQGGCATADVGEIGGESDSSATLASEFSTLSY
jgi:hypothetical protein